MIEYYENTTMVKFSDGDGGTLGVECVDVYTNTPILVLVERVHKDQIMEAYEKYRQNGVQKSVYDITEKSVTLWFEQPQDLKILAEQLLSIYNRFSVAETASEDNVEA